MQSGEPTGMHLIGPEPIVINEVLTPGIYLIYPWIFGHYRGLYNLSLPLPFITIVGAHFAGALGVLWLGWCNWISVWVSNILESSPRTLGFHDSIWLAHAFSKGLVQPPTIAISFQPSCHRCDSVPRFAEAEGSLQDHLMKTKHNPVGPKAALVELVTVIFSFFFPRWDKYWVVVSDIFYFHPYLGKMNPFWLIWFKGVETTN